MIILILLLSTVYCKYEYILENYPHLECSVCTNTMEAIGEMMNYTSKRKEVLKVSHRFNVNQYRSYETSELRAIEIISGICKWLQPNVSLNILQDGVRLFRRKKISVPLFYTPWEQENLYRDRDIFQKVCFAMIEEFEEEIIEDIRTKRKLTALIQSFCYQKSKFCDQNKVKTAEEKDRQMKIQYMENQVDPLEDLNSTESLSKNSTESLSEKSSESLSEKSSESSSSLSNLKDNKISIPNNLKDL